MMLLQSNLQSLVVGCSLVCDGCAMESLNLAGLNLLSTAGPSNEGQTLESSEDSDNEVDCEYCEDIWRSLLEQEAEKPPIHLQSPQLEFRGALVKQLRAITKKLGLTMATLHAAVAQLDLFMDAHRLRGDRLTLVALACLSIVAKSEEKFNRVPNLQVLSKLIGVQICGKTFRQLEWMVGQHARWRLLAPTPVTFASLLAQYVVTKADLSNRHPRFIRRYKKDGAKLLDAYLDLTLSDVRLKVVESVDVGCACVACARVDLGLRAWPHCLEAAAGKQFSSIAPIARRLQKMMQIMKSREMDSEADQGYSSARTSPNQTPSASPSIQVSPAPGSFSYRMPNQVGSYSQTVGAEYSILDMDESAPENPREVSNTAVEVDVDVQRVDLPPAYQYSRARRLLDAGLSGLDGLADQPSGSIAVKRRPDTLLSKLHFQNKRYRLATPVADDDNILIF